MITIAGKKIGIAVEKRLREIKLPLRRGDEALLLLIDAPRSAPFSRLRARDGAPRLRILEAGPRLQIVEASHRLVSRRCRSAPARRYATEGHI